MMKYYTFCQNNSGGYFIKNDDVANYVVVQAVDSESARQKFHAITEDYLEYCECCGERWYNDVFEENTELRECAVDMVVYHSDGIKETNFND